MFRAAIMWGVVLQLVSSLAAGQPASNAPPCQLDQDCAVLPRRCPWCGPRQRSLRDVGTQEEARHIRDRMVRSKCAPSPCPLGSSEANWVDTEAKCAHGRCVGIQKVAAELHGDASTKLFHTSICPHYGTCKATFSSEAAAARAGYRRHEACRPSRLGVHSDLACQSDGDCVFTYPGPCGRCPQPQNCVSTWHTATNRAAFARARGPGGGPPVACSPCMGCPPTRPWSHSP